MSQSAERLDASAQQLLKALHWRGNPALLVLNWLPGEIRAQLHLSQAPTDEQAELLDLQAMVQRMLGLAYPPSALEQAYGKHKELGPLLARIGQARVALPGGCAIGARPVDQHLKGLELMGASFQLEEGYIIGRCRKLKGAHISFDMPTVGGTENLLMAAALAEGETVLENAAREPEIVDLANFLRACGAKIEGHGTSVIRIEGVTSLHDGEYPVMPDRIEAGTFLVAAGITGGELMLRNCPFKDLEAVILKLRSMGMEITSTPEGVLARCAGPLRGTDVKTQPYPGFPTDMQAQLMALMCLAEGASVVEESIFENRFMHVLELMRMGAQIKVSGHTAMVRGVQKLTGAPVMASDLRASASLVLAGLAAKGVTEVRRIYHLDRGYESIEHKLNAVGARIRREHE